MVAARPRLHVLTDGAGHNGLPRLASTTAIVHDTGSAFGSVYGRMSDRGIYAAMLAGEHGRFLSLAEELAASFLADGVDMVAGDAVEGYNPSHDVCRYVINAAVRIAASESGRAIANYDFPLVARPDSCPDRLRDRALSLQLDDEALARKLEAAKGYPELAAEVEHALREFGTEPFRTECLRPVDDADPYGLDPSTVPFYETYGEERVSERRLRRRRPLSFARQAAR
jgi:hypothetical protein